MLTDLADKLRSYSAPDGSKLTVVEVDGWQNRGYADQSLYGVYGHIFHHTASNQSSGLDVVTLNMCTYGRSDLPGPLCQLMLGRSGTVYVVAAGLANHAGAGYVPGVPKDMGNYYLLGTEMESDGVSNDWTEAQLRVMPHLGAAIEEAYGAGNRGFIQVGHKEYSSQGKIDPSFIDMDDLRDNINSLLDGVDRSSGLSAQVETLKKEVKEVNENILDIHVKEIRTGKTTTLSREVSWLSKNFEDIFKSLARIETKLAELEKKVK